VTIVLGGDLLSSVVCFRKYRCDALEMTTSTLECHKKSASTWGPAGMCHHVLFGSLESADVWDDVYIYIYIFIMLSYSKYTQKEKVHKKKIKEKKKKNRTHDHNNSQFSKTFIEINIEDQYRKQWIMQWKILWRTLWNKNNEFKTIWYVYRGNQL